MTGIVPPAAPGPDRSTQDPSTVERPVPIEHAVLWQPVAVPDAIPNPGAYPVFVTRRALEALNHHAAPSSTAGVFGFLVGDLCHCPRTGVLYLVVDAVIGLPQPVYGDKTRAVVAHVWPTMQQQRAKLKRHLLGWYHSHPPLGLMLASEDVEAHFAYFPLPWQVALVLGLGEHGPEAGLFRPIPEAAPPEVPLPFFEVLDPHALTADGRPRSFVRWQNYQGRRPAAARHVPESAATAAPPVTRLPGSSPPVAPAAPPSPPPSPRSPPTAPAAPVRDSVTAEPSDVAAGRIQRVPEPRPDAASPAAPRHAPRALRLTVLIGLAGVGALLLLVRAILRARATPGAVVSAAVPAAHPPVAPAAPSSAFAAVSDSLGADLRDYLDRAARFADQRTDCQALASAFATVEQGWIAYSVQRRQFAEPLDPARVAADSGFYSAMDSVESGYERSGCPRP